MVNHKKNTHEFSVYWPHVSQCIRSIPLGTLFVIDDEQIYHRLARVLRLKIQETVILFDQMAHISVELVCFRPKNTVELKLIEKFSNVVYDPSITFYVPLMLKREAFEHAMYTIVEFGGNEIQLMITNKTQRAWGGKKEYERLKTIIIAAAEQSKSYAFPTIHEPKKFSDLIATISHDMVKNTFFFDQEGDDLFPIIESCRLRKPNNIFLMIGPEGDLTIEEKTMLKEKNISFCRLTPTILRAQQAVAASLAVFRSLL